MGQAASKSGQPPVPLAGPGLGKVKQYPWALLPPYSPGHPPPGLPLLLLLRDLVIVQSCQEYPLGGLGPGPRKITVWLGPGWLGAMLPAPGLCCYPVLAILKALESCHS
jgi:hypothetical protein